MRRKATSHKHFFDRWAKDYDAALASYGYAAPGMIFDSLWPILSLRPDPVFSLLDLGIGTGMTSQPFRATGRTHITGIDISERMLNLCRAKGVADELIQMDAGHDDLPFLERSFDAVIAGGLVEFIAQPDQLFLEIANVLKPAGLVAVTFETPLTRDIYRPGFFEGVLEHDEDHVVVQRFAIQKLRPCLYRKYLYSPEIIEGFFEAVGISVLGCKLFTAYKWPGGQEITYGLFIGSKR